MHLLLFALPVLIVIATSLSARPSLACTSGSQCNDGNTCTVDYCALSVCQHTQVANGTPCNDGSSCSINDQCASGICIGAPPPEVCTGSGVGVDEDCDGTTDESVPVEGSTCEGPTGVFETNNWFKQRPANGTLPNGFIDPGDPCNWGVECVSAVCMRVNGSEAICGMRTEVPPPPGWVLAYVEKGSCPTGANRMIEDMYVPPIVGWINPATPRAFNQTCNANANCSSGICIRKPSSGRCGERNYGTPCAGTLTRLSNYDTCYYCDALPTDVCIPSSATCTPTAADPCTWDGSVWDCP